jgi:hypothetical protein
VRCDAMRCARDDDDDNDDERLVTDNHVIVILVLIRRIGDDIRRVRAWEGGGYRQERLRARV